MPSPSLRCPTPRRGSLFGRGIVAGPWLGFVLALVLCACGGPDEGDAPYRVVARLLPEVPEVFSPDELATFETVLDDDLARAETVARWARRGFDLADKADPGGEWILGASGRAELERVVELEAEGVDRIEVLMLGLENTELELAWAGPGEEFDDTRRLVAKARRHEEPPSFRFELAQQALWSGTIERLRLRFEPGAHRRARLVRIWAVERRTDREGTERAFARTWKVRFRSDTRSARLVSTERPFEHVLQVPPGAVLEGAFGLHRKNGPAVPFTIEVASGGETRPVFEAEVGKGALAPVLWHPARVDLSPWAGHEVTLRFRAEAPESVLATWGELEILAPAARDAAADTTPDVILVVVDTLRADRLSFYGYEHETAPRLGRWAERHGVVFRSAVSSAPWTYPSHVSLFTGLDTLSHGYNDAVMLSSGTEMLAEILQQAGYETLAVTAGGFVSPRFGFAQGFDRYFTNTRGDKVDEGDLPFNIERSLAWLGEGDRPRFLFLHTFEVHSPYHVRQPYYRQLFGDDGDPEWISGVAHLRQENRPTAGAVVRRTMGVDSGDGAHPITPDEFQLVSKAYDSGIAYADQLLVDFFGQLEQRGRPTLIVLTSDHGEALGEHGGLGEHGYLYDHNLMVPLVLALPGGEGAGKAVARQVRTVDIFPTVLDALGLAPRPAIDGRSLLPLVADERADFPRVAWSSTAMQGVSLRQDDKLKYIANPTVWERERAPEALYRLDRDPRELDDLAGSEPTESFRRATLERYHLTLKGLLLVVDQPADAPAGSVVERLEITAPETALGPPQIRSFDAPPDALPVPRPGQVEILTPPGESFSVALERVGPRSPLALRLVGATPCEVGLAELVGTAQDTPPPIRLGPDCRPIPEGEKPSFVLTLLFSGAESTGDEAPKLSPDLERQLKALGYLD